MARIIIQRCFNHALREAVARCPECGQFYCRECITEHAERVLCASCLAAQGVSQAPRPQWVFLGAIAGFGQILIGLMIIWAFFYCVGELLLRLPSNLHEGTIWEEQS